MPDNAAGEELENLPMVFPIDPARPRLVGCGPGRLPLAMYSNIKVRSESNWVVVEPDFAVYRATTRFLLGLAFIYPLAIEWVVRHFIRPESDQRLAAILMPLPAIPLLAGAVFVRWLGKSQTAKGPILRYSQDDQQFRLLRTGHSIRREQVVRLDVISGAWVRTGDSETYTRQGSSELHMVIRLVSGTLVSLPVLGTQGVVRSLNRGLGQVAQTLSNVSGVPLERVKESTSFFDPYKKRSHGPMH